MSATRVKHQEWAEAFITDAQQPFDPNEPTHDGRDATVAENLAFAQVHATLALVEQQRIANLISLMQMQAEIDENTDLLAGEALHSLIDSETVPAVPGYGPAGIDERVFIRPEIREALGLA